MKPQRHTYQAAFVLLALWIGLGGISSLQGQEAGAGQHLPPDTLTTLVADTLQTPVGKADILQTDSLTAADASHAADSLHTLATGDAGPDIATVDTARLSALSDSLLNELQKPIKVFVPNPQRALWLSLILPGAGQIYNRKYWKLPIVYGGFLGCIYALTWNNQMYRDYSQAYLDIMDDDPNTKSYEAMLPLNYDITGREERFKTIFKNKKNYFRKYRDMSIFAFIGVYLLSVVDAYVDAELSSFDISKDLSLRVEPTLFNSNDTHPGKKKSNVGVQCKLNF